jgi:hypothetical protein
MDQHSFRITLNERVVSKSSSPSNFLEPYLGRAETLTRVWNEQVAARETNTLPHIYYRFHAQYLDGLALACVEVLKFNRSRVPNADVARFSNSVQIRNLHICSKIGAYSAFVKLVRTSLWFLSFSKISAYGICVFQRQSHHIISKSITANEAAIFAHNKNMLCRVNNPSHFSLSES